MFNLENKVAVVTGAGSGLGYATTERFIKAGAQVVAADINDKASEKLSKSGCFFVQADVSNEKDIESLMKKAKEKFGKINIIVNNAGIICPEELIIDANPETYRKLMDVRQSCR